jgi:hypothetical protein
MAFHSSGAWLGLNDAVADVMVSLTSVEPARAGNSVLPPVCAVGVVELAGDGMENLSQIIASRVVVTPRASAVALIDDCQILL